MNTKLSLIMQKIDDMCPIWTTNALLTRIVMALTPIDKNFFLLQTTNAPYFHKV